MTKSQKKGIVAKLKEYCEQYESQNKAANTMPGVSSAIVSQMIGEQWAKISDEMWRSVAYYVGWHDNEWNAVETRTFKMYTQVLKDAQNDSMVFGVVGPAGSGKTFTAKIFQQNQKRVYLLECSEYWNRKIFLETLMRSMGRDYRGLRVHDMMQDIVRQLRKQDRPLIIFDEADKLNDSVLHFFISIYNSLEDHCGIILTATGHLKKKIERGVRLQKKGYNEIYSRIGRKFVELNGIGSVDVNHLCTANGIKDKLLIRDIYEDSDEDLRRVKRRIYAETRSAVGA